MKPLLVLAILSCLALTASSQTPPKVYTIPADSTLLTGCDSNELIIENHTQAVSGFLWNNGRGRTIFKRPVTKINDSIYLIGVDTVNVGSRITNAWLQNLNSFGTTGKFGTFDKYNVEFYTNHQLAAVLDTFGELRIGSVNNGAPYKLEVSGPAWVSGSIRLGSSDGNDITMNTNGVYGVGSQTTPASLITIGAPGGSFGTNKVVMGNIPAGSFNLGNTGPFRLVSLTDGSQNAIFVVDGIGTAWINGGYNGIRFGGSITTNPNRNAPNFVINGGRGTGSGAAGDIVIATGNTQSSDSTIHTMTNRWWVKGNNGYLTNSDSSATSTIDLKGAAGYSQFRMRTTYTPSSTSDTNGNVGDFSWDDNYFYYKTSVGWKRISASTF